MRLELAHRGALPVLVARHFRMAGFGHKEAEHGAKALQSWFRPPLLTDARLGDEPLAPHLATPVGLELDALCDVYERFIGGYIYTRQLAGHTDEDQWLAIQLSLTATQRRAVFMPRSEDVASRQAVHWNLVQFAALVAQNHVCRVEETHNTFAVYSEKEGFGFGVKDGRLVSNVKRNREIPVRFLSSPTGRLRDVVPCEPSGMGKITMFDTLLAWLELSVASPLSREATREQGHALHEALTILRWRSPWAVPAVIRVLGDYGRSNEALSQACKLARGYATHSYPLELFKDLFVPNFLSMAEFNEMFVDSAAEGPMTEAVCQKWDLAIGSLCPEEATE